MSTSWSRALLWSLIAAAFIGPGTVTTAARAGSEGGWYYTGFVALAAIAGFLLMEMAARLTLVSGRTLGEILGQRGKLLAYACFGAVLLGCVAYQAGNLLGALGGIQLMVGGVRYWVIALGMVAGLVLWPGNTQLVSRALAGIVALMGILFLVAAVRLLFGEAPLTGAGNTATNTVIGLVGTTIVPYNFFLAAGLSRGQQLSEMRSGLLGSFLVGALITLSILLVGSVTTAFSSFADLARTLDAMIGQSGGTVLGIGLFAAGFSSAVTAPLAAAIAGRQLLGRTEQFGATSIYFRGIWLFVLTVGLLVALLDLDIITVILAAQVANGLLLPLVAAIVLVYANDYGLLGKHVNRWWQNAAGFLVAGFLAQKNGALLLGKLGVTEDFWSYGVAVVYLVLVGRLAWQFSQRRKTQREQKNAEKA